MCKKKHKPTKTKGTNVMKLLKKMLIPMLLLTLIISMVPSVSADFGRSYTAKYGTPDIDGKIDAVWDTVEWTYVDKTWDGVNESDAVVKVKLLWDEGLLYFLADIYDSNYAADLDMFEVYVDMTNTKSVEYGSDDSQTRFKLDGETVKGIPEVAGKNAQQAAEFYVEKVDDTNYIMEGGLSHVAGTPQAGNVYGIEFMYSDGRAGGTEALEHYRWNINQPAGELGAWESTEHWGTLYLADQDGIVPENVPALTPPPTDAPTEAPTEPETTIRNGPNVVTKASTTAANTTAGVDDAPAGEGLPIGVIIGIGVAVVAVAAAVIIIVIKKKNS